MDELFSAVAWQKVWTFRAAFLTGFGNTLKTAAVALLLALALGFLFGLMSTSSVGVLRGIARVYVEFIQNTPVVLQMCFLYYVLAFSGFKVDIIVTGASTGGAYAPAYVLCGALFFVICFPLSHLATRWETMLKRRESQTLRPGKEAA